LKTCIGFGRQVADVEVVCSREGPEGEGEFIWTAAARLALALKARLRMGLGECSRRGRNPQNRPDKYNHSYAGKVVNNII
jgi:hypothetical protein